MVDLNTEKDESVVEEERKAMGRCRSALLASVELLNEECSGIKGTFINFGNDIIIYVPENTIKEIKEKVGHDLNNPITPDTPEYEKAVDTCVRESVWADQMVKRFLGENIPEDVAKAFKRHLCKKILSKI